MKIYQLTVTFIEPTEATITLHADSEEEAIATVTAQLKDQVTDLVFKTINDVTDVATPSEDGNIINFAEARNSVSN